MKPRLGLAVALGACALALACGGGEPPPATPVDIEPQTPRITSVEIAELEIRESGVDRFEHCPPPGEIGQRWIPPIPPWTAPPEPEPPPTGGGSAEGAPLAIEAGTHEGMRVREEEGRTRTERAIETTRAEFRRCYRRGLLYDPTQDGHAAIVLRVGPDGRVLHVEVYGACDLASDAIQCMMDTAKTLRFEGPSPNTPDGSETIVVPVVFTGQTAQRITPLPTDAYTAECYIALEQARPALHACVKAMRSANKSVFATATLTLDIDARGTVTSTNIDPWTGEQDLLACAAEAIGAVKFPEPPAGRGRVLARLNFNPRPGTR